MGELRAIVAERKRTAVRLNLPELIEITDWLEDAGYGRRDKELRRVHERLLGARARRQEAVKRAQER